MTIIRKEKSLIPFYEYVVLKAKYDDECRMSHLCGTKLFWVEEDRVRIRVKKSECLEVGDDVSLSWLVMQNQDAFKWNWC